MKNDMSRNGIFYDLKKSNYRYFTEYNNGDRAEFVFSSSLYYDKFFNRIAENRRSVCESISKRFNLNCEFNILSDISLYCKIEKRGFLIYYNGKSMNNESCFLLYDKMRW